MTRDRTCPNWMFKAALSAAVLVAACAEEAPPADSFGSPPPDTDVYLVSIAGEGPALTIGAYQNLTDRPGYDNQPAFTSDGAALLYTAADEAGRTDIVRFDLGEGRANLLTQTYPESEYSATPLPDGTGFSVIRVEADSTQRLWRFDWDGSGAALVLPDVSPAGYHAWSGPETLVLFVLGDPPTLQVAQVGAGSGRVVEEGIGRSLQQVPGSPRVSYMSNREAPPALRILDPPTGESSFLAPALGSGQDHAWTPGGTLLVADGGVVHRWDLGEEVWVPVPMEVAFDGEISRMAVSPQGDYLAFVGAR